MPTEKKLAGTKDPVTRRQLLEVGLVLVFPARAGAQPTKRMRLAHAKGESLSFLYGNQPLFDYRYSPSRPKTYVHPLYAPNGLPITLDGTADHIHHRGLMLAWTNVNGFDFWGETDPGVKGQIVHQAFENMREGAAAEITAINHWVGGGRTLVVERRRLRAPAPTGEFLRLEWQSELRAAGEAVILQADHADRPVKAEYNGLGIRFVYSMNRGRALNSNATAAVERANGERARWCAFQGPLEVGSYGGAAIFDHPRNPRHPTPFYVAAGKTFSYLSAAPTWSEPLKIEAGAALQLRYAVVTFTGDASREKLDRLYAEWREASG
ncbi:MAG: PmoA family protein [Acidobacteriota bacterium]